MSRQPVAILLCLGLLATALGTTVAFADEPRMEVRSTHTRCEQPFEVTATGLEPLKPVLVSFTFEGQASPGAVGGTSDENGRFFSPIPRVVLPCVEGGKVTASITVDGKLLPITAQFEVAAPGAPPTAPQVGNSASAEEHSGSGWPLFAGAVVLLAAAGMGFNARRR